MKTLAVFLVLCVWFEQSWGQNNAAVIVPNVQFDVQIPGFNGPEFTTGPVIFPDKRTIFIPNVVYKGTATDLTYWTGLAGLKGQQIQVAQTQFFKNHTNLYIELPENLSLNKISFLAVRTNQSELDYVTFDSINRSLIPDYQFATDGYDKAIYRIPKCCPEQQYIDPEQGCQDGIADFQWNVTVFESNVTGLDPDIKLTGAQFELRPYFYDISCDNGVMAGVSDTDIYGLIFNSSLIIQGDGIKSHDEFCLDMVYDNKTKTYDTQTIVCYRQLEQGFTLTLYLPVLVASMICFAATAVIYCCFLKSKNVISKCVILFSTSMTVTCLSLILVNVQSNEVVCNLFGFILLSTTIFSFLWLGLSCFEIFFLVKFPLERNRRYESRFYWYIGISSGVTLLMLIISLFSGDLWQPDILSTIVRHSNQCSFSATISRSMIMYVPMLIAIVLSLVFVCLSSRLIRQNDRNSEVMHQYDWIDNKNAYSFVNRTYVVVIFASCFWFTHLFNYGGTTQLALDVLEASLGIITLTTFVLNKYTTREIKRRFQKEPITENSLHLTNLPTPTTPELERSFDESARLNSNSNQ